MNCPFCSVILEKIKSHSQGFLCPKCIDPRGRSAFSIRIKDDVIYKFFVTLGNYRLINDMPDDEFCILTLIEKQEGIAQPDYNTLYESSRIDCDPFDIAKLESIVKTILVFM